MSKKPPVHTVHNDNGWANKREGSDKVTKYYPTKQEAVTAGKSTAQLAKTEHVIHNLDGKIGQKNSYGNDPIPPKG
jgi:hypothetical protein